jgi:hypothetical protein
MPEDKRKFEGDTLVHVQLRPRDRLLEEPAKARPPRQEARRYPLTREIILRVIEYLERI